MSNVSQRILARVGLITEADLDELGREIERAEAEVVRLRAIRTVAWMSVVSEEESRPLPVDNGIMELPTEIEVSAPAESKAPPSRVPKGHRVRDLVLYFHRHPEPITIPRLAVALNWTESVTYSAIYGNRDFFDSPARGMFTLSSKGKVRAEMALRRIENTENKESES